MLHKSDALRFKLVQMTPGFVEKSLFSLLLMTAKGSKFLRKHRIQCEFRTLIVCANFLVACVVCRNLQKPLDAPGARTWCGQRPLPTHRPSRLPRTQRVGQTQNRQEEIEGGGMRPRRPQFWVILEISGFPFLPEGQCEQSKHQQGQRITFQFLNQNASRTSCDWFTKVDEAGLGQSS